jgi:hypothetical protein
VVEVFLKVYFIKKYIKIIFFYFKKIIYNINVLKRFKNIKKIVRSISKYVFKNKIMIDSKKKKKKH